jgi:hypothetical protein
LNNSIGNSTPKELVNSKGNSTLIGGYTSSSITLNNKLKLNIGVNAQLFTLNNNYTVEPRIGIKHNVNGKHLWGVAYGLHSRLDPLNFYFNNSLTTGEKAVNKNLDFTKAHHFVLSYQYKINNGIRLLIEPYFQYLYSVPVIADSSFSLLNIQGDWFFAEKLENTGKGRNYGIDITLEKHLSKGFYYLFTASVFQAKYKGGDHIWRNTRFNRSYVFNFLTGKEWPTGKNKQNLWSLNTRFTYQGGNRFSPVNTNETISTKDIVYLERDAFTQQAPSSVNIHLSISYRKNKKKSAQEFSLKILNASGQPDFYGYKYNFKEKTIDKDITTVIIPNLSYKVEF